MLGLYDRSRAELCGLQASSWGALRGGQWLALRLQLLAASLVAAVALLAVLDAAGRLPWAAPAGGAGAGLVGLSLSYARAQRLHLRAATRRSLRGRARQPAPAGSNGRRGPSRGLAGHTPPHFTNRLWVKPKGLEFSKC